MKAWLCIFDYGDAVAWDCREHVCQSGLIKPCSVTTWYERLIIFNNSFFVLKN